MKPRESAVGGSRGALFKSEFRYPVNDQLRLVNLAGEFDWSQVEKAFRLVYSEAAGRPGILTRVMVAL